MVPRQAPRWRGARGGGRAKLSILLPWGTLLAHPAPGETGPKSKMASLEFYYCGLRNRCPPQAIMFRPYLMIEGLTKRTQIVSKRRQRRFYDASALSPVLTSAATPWPAALTALVQALPTPPQRPGWPGSRVWVERGGPTAKRAPSERHVRPATYRSGDARATGRLAASHRANRSGTPSPTERFLRGGPARRASEHGPRRCVDPKYDVSPPPDARRRRPPRGRREPCQPG